MLDDPSPVLGRHSPAASVEPGLRSAGDAATAAYRMEGGSTRWCALRAASITGVRHRLAAQEGEDCFAWAHSGGRLAVAVADGLGSVAGSGGAASRAAAAAVAAAADEPGPLEAALRAGLRAANEAAGGGGGTTLVLAAVADDGAAELVRVGDSTAFLVGGEGTGASELFAVRDDEGVGTETDALPGEEPVGETASVRLGGDVLVLATDGVADPWRDGPATVAPTMAAALAAHPAPLDLARLADFSRQGCHDDRALVAVWMLVDE